MKKNFVKKSLYISIALIVLLLSSCYQPSPLTGTWADNKGNQINLLPDYTYTAKIQNSYGELKQYSGTYNVLMNAISFVASDGYQMVTEWDIRGSMLYLLWSNSDGDPLQLTLYKTKN